MKGKSFKRLLSFVTALAMLVALAIPASAAQNARTNVTFEKVDNSTVSASAPGRDAVEENQQTEPQYADTDVVRVSIVLDDPSTIEAGYSTTNIASNRLAAAYREKLQKKQDTVTSSIERATGDELDVVWNLTLAANIISANVEYGQIEDILAIPGVADVVIETSYAPAVVETNTAADPNMATSSSMIGSTNAYLEGYTGAGTRIAVIDTGIDDDHQSFDAGAYEYALSKLAEKAGVDYDEYVASLNLLTAEEVASVADQLNANSDEGFEADKTYLSSKIPYAYNYVDDDYDINHDNDTQGEHGSHVTGIAAANSYIPDGEGGYVSALDSVLTQGVASEAQIITMKVFGKGGGAYDSDYMAAIEDAIILGADAVNLSLGSANPGNSYSSEAEYQSIMDSLSKTDTVVSISASNSYSWAEYSYNVLGYYMGQGYPYVDSGNFNTVGSPGSFTNSLSVASADNTGFTGAYLTVGGENVFYTETTGYGNEPLATLAGEQEYVFVDGIGTEEDFAAVADELAGKIAVCSRGEISFAEKANNAVKYGAIGVIVANNEDGSISMDLTGYEYTAPCVSITLWDAMLLIFAADEWADDESYCVGTMTIADGISSSNDPDADVIMSDFSSWGVPGSLELKPEITAPGGNIYSVNGAIAGGTSYENMSGTSMAAPQVAGMAALMAQYIRENGLAEKTGLSVRTLSQSLLMSTAVPLYEADSGYEYYSILKQGAGLANVGAAVKATSYILMNKDATASYADGKVKAELGDDPEKTGEYSFSFTINNLADEAGSYLLSADLFTQDVFESIVNVTDAGEYEYGDYLDTWTAPLAYDVTWVVNGETLELPEELANMDFNGDGRVNAEDGEALLDLATGARESIEHEDVADLSGDGLVNSYDAYLFFVLLSENSVEVPANGSVEIKVTLKLTESQKKTLNETYPAGAYVEGFVYAEALTTEEGVLGTCHSIPVLGYYGSWTDPSMYDLISWTEFYSGSETRWNYLGTYYSNYVTVKYAGDSGEYALGGNPFYREYDETRNAINSVNGDVIASAVYALIRNAAAGKLTVTNTTTGEVEFEQEIGETDGAFYYVSGGVWYYTSNSETLNFVPQGSEGDRYVLSLTMAPEYYLDEDGNVDWDVLGDGATLSIPFTVDNTAPVVEDITGANIHTEGALEITASDNQYIASAQLYDAAGKELLWDAQGEQEKAGEKQTFTVEGLETGVYLLQVYDYAMNCSTYRVFVNTEETEAVESVEVYPTELTVMKGTTATVTAMVFPVNVSDNSVTWTSSDESIATVNENGVVTGVEKGECTITAVSNLDPDVSASIPVTVKTAAVTLYGALQDKDGDPLLFSWDMENDSTWTAYAELENNIASLAWDWLDDDMPLYQQNGSGYMYKVDADTGETLDKSASANLFGAPMQDTDFAFYNYMTTGKQLEFGVHGAYLLGPNAALDNTFSNGWDLTSYLSNYTGASKFVAIAWGGIDSSYRDCMYALDDAGYLWLLRYDGTSSIGLGFIPTDLDLPFPTYDDGQYCSMVFDDDLEVIYLSYFTGSTNEIYMLEFDGESGFTSNLIGDVGDNVWPAALFWALPNAAEGESLDSTARAEKISSVSSAAAAAEIATVESEVIDLAAIAQEPTGGLNSVAPSDDTDVTVEENDRISIPVTEDVVSHNGVIVASYDPEVLELTDLSINGNYTSKVIDEEAGTVTIGYVSLKGVPAGNAVANLEFAAKVCNEVTTVSITHQEVNDETPDEENATEPVTFETPEHVYGEPEFIWAEDFTSCKAVFPCAVGDDVQVVEAEITSETTEATCNEDGATVYTATVTFNGETYTDVVTVAISATGHTYGEPEFRWDEENGCEAVFTCVEGDDTAIVRCVVTSETTEATETEDGAIVYTATVTFNGKTYTSTKTVVIPATGSGTKPGDGDVAKTGDSSNLVVWIVIGVVALACCAYLVIRSRKRTTK